MTYIVFNLKANQCTLYYTVGILNTYISALKHVFQGL